MDVKEEFSQEKLDSSRWHCVLRARWEGRIGEGCPGRAKWERGDMAGVKGCVCEGYAIFTHKNNCKNYK